MKIKDILSVRMTKVSWIIFVLFLIFGIMDFYTTFSFGDDAGYLENNPLFPYIGFYGIIAMNILALFVMLKAYQHGSMAVRYFVVTFIVYFTLLRAWVIKNNLAVKAMYIAGEINIEAEKMVPQEVKTLNHLSIILPLYGPLLISMLIYMIFKIDHKIEKCH